MKPIAIIDCAIEKPAISCFNQLVTTYQLPFTYHAPPLNGFDSLKHSINQASAYFIFGSYSHVHQKLDWQIKLASFIKDRILNNIPVIGICFGHQLVAHIFGGTIGEKKSYNGYRKITIEKDLWNFQQEDQFNLIVLHEQEIINLPTCFDVIASSKDCEYEMVCHKEYPYFGIQAHPEASIDFIEKSIQKKINQNTIDSIAKDSKKVIEKLLKNITSDTSNP